MNRNVFLVYLFFALTSCAGLNKLSLYNLSDQYTESAFTNIEAVALNDSTDHCTVYIPVIMSDMVVTTDDEGIRHRDARLSYRLFESYDSKHILDSSSVFITDTSLLVLDTTIELGLSYPAKQKYILKLELTDLNRVDAVTAFLDLNNKEAQSRNSFLLKNVQGEIIYGNILSEQEAFVLEQAEPGTGMLYVRYYSRQFPLALPPFIEEKETNFDYRADSIFIVEFAKGRTPVLQFPDEGFYHFQLDSNSRGGFTIFRFERGFPGVMSPEQMLQPLRYITTLPEYEKMEEAVDTKLAIDNFWLGNAGNPSRARAMIQKFYGRVEEANRYFSSYHEGWKTDRGLIYIVYGPPRIVYRGVNIEEWLYGEQGNNNSIRLQFVKVENPFSENDYSLIKSPSYKEQWYNLVNTWRR